MANNFYGKSLKPGDDDQSQREPTDKMDLEQLRLSQEFVGDVAVRKHIATVPIRKPDRQWWFRVHPEWSFTAAILELRDTRENYLVLPALRPELPGEAIPTILFPAISRQGVVFLWPVRPDGLHGRRNEWNRSSLEAAMLAKVKWTRLAANLSLGAYEIFTAPDGLSDPVWPDLSFEELLRIAFRDRIIDSLDHPIVRQLRGEQ
jgi:hypothetical protein